jgi:hypothetical protein
LRTLILRNDGREIHLVSSRPFSISNPADRVFFVERTFMCLVSTPLG